MKVTVATLSDSVFTLDVGEDLEIENFKVRFSCGLLLRFNVSLSRFFVRLSLAFPVQR